MYKVFLGMAAGVGKTYRMLAEAQAQAEAGRDVVVGRLETHGRTETEALAAGLEVVPRRRVAYRDVTRALREVALRQVAETVELGRAEETPIAERLLALAGLADERVVRRAWRSAQRLGGELDVLVVRSGESSAAERGKLEALRRLTSVLGAHLIVEDGGDPVPALERVARERGTTYVLLAEPEARRFREPLVMRILRALPHVDVRIVRERAQPYDQSQ